MDNLVIKIDSNATEEEELETQEAFLDRVHKRVEMVPGIEDKSMVLNPLDEYNIVRFTLDSAQLPKIAGAKVGDCIKATIELEVESVNNKKEYGLKLNKIG